MAASLQALAYQWLGRWYEDIDLDYQKAQHCYERAVVLDDDDVIAGMLMHSCVVPVMCQWILMSCAGLCLSEKV